MPLLVQPPPEPLQGALKAALSRVVTGKVSAGLIPREGTATAQQQWLTERKSRFYNIKAKRSLNL